jgi:PLP dependent protein
MIPVDEPPLTTELIRSRLDDLIARLSRAAREAGRDPNGFRVVAVTKGFGLEAVRAAYDAGLTRLGENRVQEALSKVEALPEAEWHLVGHLQSNKVRPAVRAFAWIHSVDSLALLSRIEAIAHDEERRPRILLQVNVSGETSKAGFAADALERGDASGEMAAMVSGLRYASVRGLMTMAPAGASDSEARGVFRALRGLRDHLQAAVRSELPELSMGMTADAEAAVAEGATIVRIGTALFGPRPD